MHPNLPNFTQIYPNLQTLEAAKYIHLGVQLLVHFPAAIRQVFFPSAEAQNLGRLLEGAGEQLNQWFRHLKSNCLASLKIEGYLKIWGVSRSSS